VESADKADVVLVLEDVLIPAAEFPVSVVDQDDDAGATKFRLQRVTAYEEFGLDLEMSVF
jgi:hypothetical protein